MTQSVQSVLRGDIVLQGTLTPSGLNVPAGAVDDDAIKSAAAIAATKLQHQHVLKHSQAQDSFVTSAKDPLYIVRGLTATVVDIEVMCLGAPSGDKTITVDLKKANTGNKDGATILSSTISYDAAKSDAEVVKGTISSANLVDGDVLIVWVTVGGTTGNDAKGLVVTVTVREDAE